MLRLNGVARVYGDRTVFEDVDLEVGAGERLALIGENGSGKSTLLRLMAGLEAPDAGTVTRAGRVALLTQDADTGTGTVLDAVTPEELRAAQRAFNCASARLAEGTDEALTAFAEAEESYRLAGGYDFEVRAAGVLHGLGLDPQAQAARLSGGQTRRVMLARLLLSPADLYLLDEPTNHLDADGAAWLEGWIRASEAAFVLASHDRAFLDAAADRTAELERGRLTVYPGAYTAAMEVKATLREAQAREYEAYRRKREALDEERRRQASKGAVEENRRRARDNDKFLSSHKAGRAQQIHSARARAMQKLIDRLDEQAAEKPFQDRRTVRLDLPATPPGPAEVLTVRDLTVTRGGQAVLSSVRLDVRRGDRIALTGPNGGGKSTLLAALLGTLPHTGEVRWGQGLRLYAAGQHGEELADLGTVGEALLDANPALTPHQLHEVAAQVQLPGPAFPLAGLSGGQRTRLSLARLSVTRAQVLVLDEPTNHLDIRAIEALEGLLVAFPGTVLLASHDRALVGRVATRVWEAGGGGVGEV
ncbi:ABC-F family ATP-binding cassette domain-containing protein [Deinococcus metallilatus]|uniref:ABC-F family ATP-binding cassette domain-containing protein n=1 Tax=Deinococcus metallilatus TaxID=1211322 RepID=A0AAJ5F5X2_9DEIO|nr:ABC-F family ATP-binding cassette domain-containing protein [Deinococcus metallilatus]MBB5294868.1 ATP-binding cassette subfamily F protein 3 [Deinococcus metallilatus]QBY09417.1 ABC-F family ATP-binding cassette domain-containing protein [Deinococcus metallilatus]RXJ09422.1 ABC-F family ATP-binding cassette domain-containing protein [Deinococcus metallilatus]TLK28945.1 ABC-F family ATP-binding cassette domain-containing protein [Deinococcus metallilatus]GMA16795.1 ABC transporter ATP-bindi